MLSSVSISVNSMGWTSHILYLGCTRLYAPHRRTTRLFFQNDVLTRNVGFVELPHIPRGVETFLEAYNAHYEIYDCGRQIVISIHRTIRRFCGKKIVVMFVLTKSWVSFHLKPILKDQKDTTNLIWRNFFKQIKSNRRHWNNEICDKMFRVYWHTPKIFNKYFWTHWAYVVWYTSMSHMTFDS